MSEYTGKKTFVIHRNDVSQEAFRNEYVGWLQGKLEAAQCETGWLLERTLPCQPVWLCVRDEHFDWTPDASAAIRFCRRSDAEQVAEIIGEDVDKITEHEWS